MGEKNEVKLRLSTVVYLFIILVLVVAVGVVYYLGFVKSDNSNNMIANGEVAEKNNISVNEESETKKSPYEKYEGLYWQFKDSETDKTKIEWDSKKIQIENGVAYLYSGNSKTPINSIAGKAKSVIAWGEQTLQRVYILTEEGTIWKSMVNSKGDETLNSDFERVNIEGKVIDMTNGYSSIRDTEPPYFLLANGDLVNEEGSSYEELDGNFVKSLGNTYEHIFIKADNTMYTYDKETRKYTQIKDENNNSIKMRDAFVQWSSIHNNLVQETGGLERIFVITEDNKLFYFDGYSNVVAKEYKETAGKTIKNAVEEKQEAGYGNITNVRITFTDGTEKLLKDANRNFFDN